LYAKKFDRSNLGKDCLAYWVPVFFEFDTFWLQTLGQARRNLIYHQ